jgi:hypothetical protein
MSKFYRALEAKYQAQIEENLAVLDLYLNNSVGVGEHPGVIDVMDEKLGLIEDARSKLEILKQVDQNVKNTDDQ